MKDKNIIKKRKAISSVIGTFFFIIIMVAAFGALLTAMALQTDLIDSQTDLADLQVKKVKEDFTIEPYCTTVKTKILGVYVENRGTHHIEVASVWVLNNEIPFDYQIFDVKLNDSLIAPGVTWDVLSGYTDAEKTLADQDYTIKVVTSLGNTLESTIKVPCAAPDLPDVVNDVLIAKPGVYAAFPNPWVKSGDNGHWAMTITNPTDHPFWVSQVSYQLMSTSNPNSFKGSSIKSMNPLAAGAGDWQMLTDLVFWRNPNARICVDSYDVKEWQADIVPFNSIQPSPIVTVNTNAWTSFGQFGSTKIDTIATMQGDYAIPNVYYSSGMATYDQIYTKEVVGNLVDTYYVTIENSGGATFGDIIDGSYLIVNVPPGFEVISVTDLPGSLEHDETKNFADDSTQLRFRVTNNLEGDPTADANKRTISFDAKAPEGLQNPSLFVFYTFAEGKTEVSAGGSAIPIGPVAEVVVRACPDAGCPPPTPGCP